MPLQRTLCPFTYGNNDCDPHCEGANCAWWIPGPGLAGCAIAHIAKTLNYFADEHEAEQMQKEVGK